MWLVHTNDSHGRFAPGLGGRPSPTAVGLATLLGTLRAPLYLDAGDTIRAGNLGFRPGGEPALETLSELGCQAMCLGNRETHPRREIFPLKLGRARFPVLCANVAARPGAPLPVQPHLLFLWEGVRVGVFGLTVPMFTRKQWSRPFCDYAFNDPIAAAREQIEQLRPQVDLLVALTHLGFRRDRELAAACPELDLIVGGHSHIRLEAPFRENGVPIVQAGAFGECAGLARLEVAGGRGRLVSWELRPLRRDAR